MLEERWVTCRCFSPWIDAGLCHAAKSLRPRQLRPTRLVLLLQLAEIRKPPGYPPGPRRPVASSSHRWWGRCDALTDAPVSSFLDVGLIADSGILALAEPWHWRNLGTGESVGAEEFCVILDSNKLMNLSLISDLSLRCQRINHCTARCLFHMCRVIA